jgi:hypothetical protein
MNVQYPPNFVNHFTVRFTEMGSGDDAFGSRAVKVGTLVVDKAVTTLLTSSVAMTGTPSPARRPESPGSTSKEFTHRTERLQSNSCPGSHR